MAKYKSGVAGIFVTEEEILTAARGCRDLGLKYFDAITPYPVHGMEEACGIKRSWIPYVTFVAALTGLTLGLLLTWWTSAVNWPINVGGKPFFSLPAFVPIMFELTILLAALGSVGALFYAAGMPRLDPPRIHPDLTSHKFAIFIPNHEAGYNESKLMESLHTWGATEVMKAEH